MKKRLECLYFMNNASNKSLISFLSVVISFSASLPAFAQSTPLRQSIDSKATYLRTGLPDVGALDAVVIDLINLGILPGSTIRLQQLGSFRAIGGFGDDTSIGMGGVFSSSSTLLDRNLLNRVPGAIDAGIDNFTGLTRDGDLSTDIPEDFRITDIQLLVPAGANFLFVGALDSRFQDNTDLDRDFAVQISTVALPPPISNPESIPEPNTVAGLFVLGLGLLFKKQITKNPLT
jgi:hypothetical protein